MTARNKHFRTRQPFQDHPIRLERADGPFGFLNPTRAHFVYPVSSKPEAEAEAEADADADTGTEAGDSQTDATKPGHADHDDQQDKETAKFDQPAKNVRFLWRSRDNRKGRHALLVQRPRDGEEAPFLAPRRTSHPAEVLKTIKRTFTYFPVWDISWLVAFVFTLGSVVWVINAFFSWMPYVAPSTEFHNEVYVGAGVTAFIGAIIFFETGSILLIIEATNSNHAGCFGWAVERLFADEHGGGGDGTTPVLRFAADRHSCRHHHQNRRNIVGRSGNTSGSGRAGDDDDDDDDGRRSWKWFPSWHDLRTHYVHELGFLAGCAQLFGATVFGVAGFTALPGIFNHLTPQSTLNGAYWIPQVIGGSGFIVSGTLYMLETQQKWYVPAPKVLGWHIAFWNLIGGFGFTLCGVLGMAYGNSGAQYQASLATFWGSWAFLIGSYLQLYESLDKHPVEEVSSDEDFGEKR